MLGGGQIRGKETEHRVEYIPCAKLILVWTGSESGLTPNIIY